MRRHIRAAEHRADMTHVPASPDPAEAALTEQARNAVARLGAAPAYWVADSGADTDVAIIGGGQSGITIGFALRRAGIHRFTIFDDSPPGIDVWNTIARMRTLRTPKTITSLELGIPELSFRNWYETLHGAGSFERIVKIATPDWARYVDWFRRTVDVPVQQQHRLTHVRPRGGHLELTIETPAGPRRVTAQKLVLATGMGGLGEIIVPPPLKKSPRGKIWAHTHDPIDFGALRGKRVAVLGAASAAFDAAGTALEQGAASVDLFCRHKSLAVQTVEHKLTFITDIPLMRQFVHLPDAVRWRIMARVRARGVVPEESIARARAFDNFTLRLGAGWDAVEPREEAVEIVSNGERFACDYLIAGTGYSVDIAALPELREAEPFVARWTDRYTPPADQRDADFARYPYLGEDFSLQERVPGTAPWVRDIHVFTVAAVLNHGFHVGDISSMDVCVPRLAGAIAETLFLSDLPAHLTPLIDPAELHATMARVEARQVMPGGDRAE
jgi:cation diffusion facilitator CzcD-associated flavoprotein CzcO